MNNLTQLTGGNFVDAAKPELAFQHTIRETHAAASLWPWLLLVVTILLPFDIAVRRVIVTRSDVQKGLDWARSRLGWLPRPQILTTSGRMTRLKDAKERAATTSAQVAPVDTEAVRGFVRSRRESSAMSAPSISSPTQAAPDSKPPVPPPISTPQPRPAVAAKPTESLPPLPSDSGGSLASRLAERRRSRKDD